MQQFISILFIIIGGHHLFQVPTIYFAIEIQNAVLKPTALTDPVK